MFVGSHEMQIKDEVKGISFMEAGSDHANRLEINIFIYKKCCFGAYNAVFDAKMGNIQIKRQNRRTISSSGPQKAAAADE